LVWVDEIALRHQQVANDAAFQVLYKPVLASGDEGAGRNNGAL
jgi:hypothetical protein